MKREPEITWINPNSASMPLQKYGVAIQYFDITEQKQATAELEHSLSLLRATLEATADGIVAFSLEGNLVCFNQKFLQMWQIPDALIKGQDANQYITLLANQLKIPENFTEMVRQADKQTDGKSYAVLELKDGRIFEIYTQPQQIKDKIVGQVCSFRDVTERKRSEESQKQQSEKERLLAKSLERIRRSLQLEEILNTTVAEVRQFLQTDRVVIYRFQPDWSGLVVVESVAPGWMPILEKTITDNCFRDSYVDFYKQGRIRAVNDINTANLASCHVELLAGLQVKANLVVPILQGKDLWGLLIAHHCRDTRQWQQLEIDLLSSLATQVAIALQQAQIYHQLEMANQELQRLVTIDGLTGLANRRRFDQYLSQEWRRSAREFDPLSLILCDVDYFKKYNDTYGHLAGDFCLQQVGDAIRQAVKRPADLVARYGGEEFAVILPNTTVEGAIRVAEMIGERVRGLKLRHASSAVSPYVTLSLGIASTVPTLDSSPQQLIATADEALYQAKAGGRDRLIFKKC